MNVAVLGASGIGTYHARDFARAGCNIVAILGRSKESAEQTAQLIKERFNISVRPYYNVNDLFLSEKIDIVTVCLPPDLHESYIRRSLDCGMHVFCEKPFIIGPESYNRAKALFDIARSRKVFLSVNMQWAIFPSLVKYDYIDSFQVYMEPGQRGVNQLLDQLCHATSVLQKLIPNGKVRGISIDKKSEDNNSVSFVYTSEKRSCLVRYSFNFKKDQPRALVFTINGEEYRRRIGEHYEQSFVCKANEMPIEDPFTQSIALFVKAVDQGGRTLLTEQEILHNIEVQEAIIEKYNPAAM